jgi:hypothetical protein
LRPVVLIEIGVWLAAASGVGILLSWVRHLSFRAPSALWVGAWDWRAGARACGSCTAATHAPRLRMRASSASARE